MDVEPSCAVTTVLMLFGPVFRAERVSLNRRKPRRSPLTVTDAVESVTVGVMLIELVVSETLAV